MVLDATCMGAVRSSLPGTQQIDRIWMHLKASIPKKIHHKNHDGNHREANAERVWKYIRQFQFRRMHTDAYKALAKLCSAAEVSQTPGAKTCLLL